MEHSFFSLHLICRRGKKSKFFFVLSHCKTHTFWCLSAPQQAHLPGVFHPICTLQSGMRPDKVPTACQSCQAHVRPHSTPMLCSSAQMLAPHVHAVLQAYKEGEAAGKEGGPPGRPHRSFSNPPAMLHEVQKYQGSAGQLSLLPIYRVTLERVHPITSIP